MDNDWYAVRTLCVGSRIINRFFLKKFEFNVVVLLQFVDRGDMPEIFLRNVVVRSREILLTLGAAVCWNRGGSYTI